MGVMTPRYVYEKTISMTSAGGGGGGTTTLDPANVGAGGTLSGGNLILTWASANANSRALSSQSTGKYYFEVTFGASMNAGFSEVGVVNSSQSMTADMASSTGVVVGFGDSVAYGNITGSGISANTITAGSVVRIAVDTTARLFWFAVGAGGWSGFGGAGTGDPVAGTGGADISGITGALFPAVRVETNSNSVLTCNFGATSYAQTPPTGYGNW